MLLAKALLVVEECIEGEGNDATPRKGLSCDLGFVVKFSFYTKLISYHNRNQAGV